MNIFKDGVLIDIKVRFWTGTIKLTSDDLGLDSKTVSKAYQLGKKMLIPKETIHKFRAIESKARFLIDNNSFKFPFGNTRFVPKKRLQKVIESLHEHQMNYIILIQELITNYNKLRKEMFPKYKEAAKVAYKRKETNTDKEEFINKYLSRIETLYPKADTLRDKFSLTWNVYEIDLPKVRDEKSDKFINLYKRYQIKVQHRIDEFLREVVTTLRIEIFKLCQRIIDNIKEGKTVGGQSISSLKKSIENFMELNFVGDTLMEEQLTRFKTDLLDKHTSTKFSKDKDLQEQLEQELNLIIKEASKTSDIKTIIEQYQKRILWKECSNQQDCKNVVELVL